jgi:E3 ubiquitin-protein ligase ZNF598
MKGETSVSKENGSSHSDTCLVCMETSHYWGIGQCGHSEICAKCHYRLRSKQQNLHCSLCKHLNMFMLIVKTEEREKVASIAYSYLKEPKDLIEYSSAAIHFTTSDLLNEFEMYIAAQCPACSEKFVHPETFKLHLAEQHRLYLCEVCVAQRPVLLSQQTIYNRPELARHLREGEIDPEGDQLLMYHPQCQV